MIETDTLKQRMQQLRALLEKHNQHYYEEDSPSISDGEYDRLFHQLKTLEQQYPSLAHPQSPTQRVGGKASGKFPTVAHSIPMLSLDNAFSEQELSDFIIRLGNLLRLSSPLTETPFCGEPKLDGLALALHYENGQLTRALTRGDGVMGEDVTANAKAIDDIPLHLSLDKSIAKTHTIEVRGEVFMRKQTLESLNQKQRETQQKTYSNSRNFAAGTLRQLDPQIVADRGLNFYAYSAISSQPISNSHHRMLKTLALWGFPINPEVAYLKGLENLMNYYQDIQDKRDSLAYDIDGIVFKLDHISLQNLAGSTQRAPRWAIAYKFPAEQAQSHVESIDVQIGRTGVLTPVARLSPTQVAGVTISNATLHNLDEIERKDIRLGDEVFIRRAGDVIPEVVKLVHPNRIPTQPPFTMPTHCPSCGSAILRETGQAHFRCTNGMNCPQQRYQAICHFISRKAMAIDGLGKQRIEQLLEQQLITQAAELYTLSEAQLAMLPKMKEKSIHNVLGSINASKQTTFARFLFAIGMHEVGEVTAQNLAQNIENKLLDKVPIEADNYPQECVRILQNLSIEALMEIEDIGPTVAKSIHQFMQNKNNQRFLAQCINNGITWQAPQLTNENTPLKKEVIVLTGTLQSMGRELAKQKLQARGAKVSSSISKSTTLVIAGTNAGSKLTKAKKLNIRIWQEEEFLKNMLE